MSGPKKIVSELSIDDLVKLATSSKEEIVMDGLSEASKFIYDVGIKHGTAKISAQLIYHTYKHWKGWGNKKENRPIFFRDFSKFFEPKRANDGTYYLLNEKPFDTSTETFWIIRKEIRDERARRKKK